MTRFAIAAAFIAAATTAVFPGLALADHDAHKRGDALNGAKLFRGCVVCHVLEPGEHRTGPSLAGLWGRKSGTAKGYSRYSQALIDAAVIWDEHTLDAWLIQPNAFIPGTTMPFVGIPNEKERTDVIAFLSLATSHTKEKATSDSAAANNPNLPTSKALQKKVVVPEIAPLKQAGPTNIVQTMHLCRDNYSVSTVGGLELVFWEYNLRLKTDSSDRGPNPGFPVIMASGIEGDRATIIFADPSEISGYVQKKC